MGENHMYNESCENKWIVKISDVEKSQLINYEKKITYVNKSIMWKKKSHLKIVGGGTRNINGLHEKNTKCESKWIV